MFLHPACSSWNPFLPKFGLRRLGGQEVIVNGIYVLFMAYCKGQSVAVTNPFRKDGCDI